MKSVVVVKSYRQLVDLVLSGKLNPDPLGQRPPVTQGFGKSQSIVHSYWGGYGVGMVTLRDIREDAEMQKIYPGVDYLVIDGGHRIRALVAFYRNRFKVDGKFFKDSKIDIDADCIPVDIVTCSSQQAITKFRTLNMTTDVNFMEMLMCDDQSKICRAVREITREYKEYGNESHPLFETSFNKEGEEKSKHFDMAPNHRRKWDEYVLIAMLKTVGGGNVHAGQKEIQELVDNEYLGTNPINSTVVKNVNRFFGDVLSFQEHRYNKLNTDIFAALQLVWFALYAKNAAFKITDTEQFHDVFMNAYAVLTGTADTSLNNVTIDYDGEKHFVKEFVRKNTKNFSNAEVQQKCAELFLEQMGDDIGVTFRDNKRTISKNEREERLALQNYKCAIDGERLELDDSVWGHDTPWAKGGALGDGAVIRRTRNIDMGCATHDEYRMILELRNKKIDTDMRSATLEEKEN